MRGFVAGHGWNGCLALPRVLTIGEDGHPRQNPIPQLQTRRGRHTGLTDLTLDDNAYTIPDACGDTLEIVAVFARGNVRSAGLRVRQAHEGSQAISVAYDGRHLDVAGTAVAFTLGPDENLKLHLFLDRSVLEVFVNNGQKAITRVIYPPADALAVEVFATGGSTQIRSLDIWEMN